MTVAGRDLEAGQRIDPDGDDEVVGQCDDRRDRHPPFAHVGPDEQDHEDDEDDQTDQRALGDRLAPGRADRRGADLALR